VKPYRISLATVALLLALSASACAGAGSQPGADEFSERNQSEHLSTVSAKDFDRTNFDNSTTVDNKWFPLEPGAHSVFEGSAIDDGERISRRVVSTVTDLTKEIDGVNTVVIWERDYSDGEEVEAELAFFAQDNYGNVWHMGEYPEEYENREFDKAPGWLAGLKGASAGIAMRAEPRLGTPGYAQGYAPPPSTGSTAGGSTRWARLSPQALAKARANALKLEKHAYEIKEYYRKTQPAKPTL
jgi:hypothetical protein